jgi:hypothetical protein
MNDDERRRFEMFLRVDGFGDAHAVSFPAGTLGQEVFGNLRAVIDELRSLAATKFSSASSAKQGTSSKGVARDRLLRRMERISNTAQAMAITTPDLNEKFRMPRSNVSHQALLSAARAFVTDARPLKDIFIRHEMPANFIEDLESTIKDFEKASEEQTRGTEERIASRAGIDEAIDRGLNEARRLDAIVRNKFLDDPSTVAEWESARHIERAPKSKPAPPKGPDSTPVK